MRWNRLALATDRLPAPPLCPHQRFSMRLSQPPVGFQTQAENAVHEQVETLTGTLAWPQPRLATPVMGNFHGCQTGG
jgi:hypothetical protein